MLYFLEIRNHQASCNRQGANFSANGDHVCSLDVGFPRFHRYKHNKLSTEKLVIQTLLCSIFDSDAGLPFGPFSMIALSNSNLDFGDRASLDNCVSKLGFWRFFKLGIPPRPHTKVSGMVYLMVFVETIETMETL